YVALEPLVEPASLDFVNAEGFVRKTAFGRRDTAIKDMAYGHLASFTMLAPNATGTGYAGQVTFSKRNWGYTLARDFTRVRLSLRTTAFVIAQIYVEDTVFSTRAFPEFYEGALALDIPEDGAFTLSLQSDESPRIFGISFESPTGVHVDNVAMRGASGMVFSKLDADQFKSHLERESYALIILQYGGNAVPYLKDEAHAKRFARSAARQINHIKSLYPNAAIIYVGPSDMARKNGLKMESYPLIQAFKQALRTEVLARGAVYWDLYDVMGGEGSMVRWVDQEPAFAVKDYIHFTPKGAQWVGNKLAEMVELAHENYRAEKQRLAAEAKRREDSVRAYNAAPVDTAAQDSIAP
ncbi:MAG: GDSL-type esterase/lipase family protein, partial [Schleiferiaceae bacterium]